MEWIVVWHKHYGVNYSDTHERKLHIYRFTSVLRFEDISLGSIACWNRVWVGWQVMGWDCSSNKTLHFQLKWCGKVFFRSTGCEKYLIFWSSGQNPWTLIQISCVRMNSRKCRAKRDENTTISLSSCWRMRLMGGKSKWYLSQSRRILHFAVVCQNVA